MLETEIEMGAAGGVLLDDEAIALGLAALGSGLRRLAEIPLRLVLGEKVAAAGPRHGLSRLPLGRALRRAWFVQYCSTCVDLFGFDGQLVFATFATAMFMGKDLDLLYAGSAAHNRAVADFCKDDPRLLPVGFIPLDDPDRAVGRC